VVAFNGTLEHFMPVQVLRFLQMARATGRLEIVNGEERADLYMLEGRSAFALTNTVHLRLGDVLVNGGDIRPEAIELMVAVQQDQPGERIGNMLVENGVIGPERMRAAVLEVQRSIVCSVLLWRTGHFTFHHGERPGDADITLDLDLDRLIVEALQTTARVAGENRLAA